MNGYLLDTHAALWWWVDSPRLGENARRLIEESTARIHLSVVSIWEIGIKSHNGRLTAIPAFRAEYPQLLAANGFDLMAITDCHALEAAYLDGPHRDPFDRLIAGQARCEQLIVITRDRELARLGCETLW
ncbi:type II toxin-antitoxin system VapC family toxin [Sphingomonas bacterium]|uniref:type II toxin-antitoxin system VapC family toxin n=1 Tax=Sphingomonas bacterium TaxID=1895847 RepID=UPI001576E840|nr:type II toxin-antitoxin system VapC family toxin [Sphingomonas bacterium]